MKGKEGNKNACNWKVDEVCFVNTQNTTLLPLLLWQLTTEINHRDVTRELWLCVNLKLFDILVHEDDGEWARVQRDEVMNVLWVQIIFVLKLVVVNDERNTKHIILRECHYLHTMPHVNSGHTGSESTIAEFWSPKKLYDIFPGINAAKTLFDGLLCWESQN